MRPGQIDEKKKKGLGRGQVKAAERKVRTWTRPGQIDGKKKKKEGKKRRNMERQ